ncbi:MAG: cupredoxin domain-containing protein [Chloroflexota bacterium]|nr:cupredoxin domain-containing protein [Chloroflexota bacterium]
MRLPRWVPIALGLTIVSAVVLFLSEAGYLGPRPTARDVNITMEARQFAFTPATFEVHQGDHVHINVQSVDVTHGIYVDSYGVQAMAQPGQPGIVDFIADRAGTYRFRCADTCGPLHPFMIGEMTVLPASSLNPGPFMAATVLAVLVAAGAVASTWRPNPTQEAIYG